MSFNYWQDFEEGKIYHIYNKAANDIVLFQDDADYNLFLSKFKDYLGTFLDVYAYCLIPNHFHFLVKIKYQEEIKTHIKKSKTISSNKLLDGEIQYSNYLTGIFKNFFSSYSLLYKNKYHHSGQVFMKRFKRVAIESDSKLLYIFCYIHHNPIHHFLVKKYEDWKYSSYKAYLKNEPTSIAKQEFLKWLGGLDTFHQVHADFKLNKAEE